jgi:hypothetical protein
VTLLLATLRFAGTSIPAPVWMLALVGGVLFWQTGRAMHYKAVVAKTEAAHQAYIGSQEQAAREASEKYRAIEHQAQANLALVRAELDKESGRAEKLEADVAAAVLRGERRVRASVCVAGRDVSGAAAAGAGSPKGSDDGARRIGAAVRRLAEGDAEIRYLRSYADACQRTCGPAAPVKGRGD